MGNSIKHFLRQSLVCLCLVLTCTLLAYTQNALAADPDERLCSITVTYPIPDVEFRLYLVGTWDGQGGYNLEDPYTSYGVNLNSVSAAATLAHYIERDAEENQRIIPLATAKSKKTEDGYAVVFDNLQKGVYMVLGTDTSVGFYRYIPSPVMVELPSWESKDSDVLRWDITIEGKYERKEFHSSTYISLKVLKVWQSDDEKTRPDSITVQLLKDGKLPDEKDEIEDPEVVLDVDNNWSYEWPKLDSQYEWTVVEKEVPEGYSVSNSKDGEEIILTNTANNPPKTPGKSVLPKTGQEWTLVLYLLTGGLFLILAGLLLRRQR